MLQTTTLAQSARLGVRTLTAGRRSYVTAQTAVGGASSQPLHSAPGAPIPAKKLESLGSIEASWVSLPRPEQERIYTELQELQKKDWKELSLDEKKASYYISYGPHGPRSPIVPANSGGKVILGSIACFGLAAGLFALARYNAHETPKTMNKEWKEAQDEYARSQKMDPFTGPSRTDGKGKSFAT